jgi:hypothetical protein
MSTFVSADSNLFSMIHALLEEQSPAGLVERRSGDRRAYACAQLVAPYDGWTLPKQADFRLVQCQDLSPTGFSFVSKRHPEYEYLVIALGAVPFTFFSAQIMHARPTGAAPGAPYVVGCKFLNRLTT